MHPLRKLLLAPFALALLCLSYSPARADELIVNGGFETGFAGWTRADQAGSNGTWFVSNSTTSPVSGSPTAGPASGNFYALTDQSGAGAHSLTQAFIVTAGSHVVVSFDMFLDNQAVVTYINPAGLDYTASPNQHARVDILRFGADTLSTAPGDVLGNLFIGGGTSGNNPYGSFSFDISPLVAAGGTFVLRFGQVENVSYFQTGVDNVRVTSTATATATPEPATLLLLGTGLTGLVGAARRRRKAGSS